MKSSLCTLVAASTLVLLTACGGNDDDTPASNSVKIASANQTSVARASLNAGLSLAKAEGALGNGENAVPDAADRSHAFAAIVRRALHDASRKAVANAGVHPAAVHSETDNCAVGGTVSSAWDDKDSSGSVTSGDVITSTFAQCRESATDSVNGVIVITLTASPVVTSTTTQIAANAVFQNLVVTDGAATYTVNGTFAANETDNDSTSMENDTLTVGNGGLTVTVASTAYSDTVTLAQGLVVNTAVAYDGSVGTVSVNGGLSSTQLGGGVTIATPTALSGAGTDPYPSSGQMLITGASGSKLRLTVIDSTQVKLEIDTDGDGTYESTSTVAWSTLVP